MKNIIVSFLAVPALVAQAPAKPTAPVNYDALQKDLDANAPAGTKRRILPVNYDALQKDLDAAMEMLEIAYQTKPDSKRQAISNKALMPIRAKQKGAKGEALEAALIAELIVLPPWVDSSALNARILKEVPATSPAWKLAPSDMLPALPKILGAEGANYLKELTTKGAPEVRRALLEGELQSSIFDEDFTKANTLLAKLKTDFPGNPDVAEIETQLKEAEAAGAATAIGAQAPEFSIPNLDDEKGTFTLATFKGNYLMLDFWATWCGPCRGELPGVHTAYAKYKDKGLEILSISADEKADDIRAFRKKPGTPMPWKHAFGGDREHRHAIYKAYGIKAFPTVLLIGPDGKILEKSNALRGEDLDKTLAKYLDKK